MKRCFKCGELKKIAEFYVHKEMKDGHLNKCIECTKVDVKLRRRTNHYVQEYDRRRYRDNKDRKDRTKENSIKWNRKYPERYKAHYLVSNAVRDGRLKKMPCCVCGNAKSNAHHEDYSKPLDVIWLCPTHHQQHHHGVINALEFMKG